MLSAKNIENHRKPPYCQRKTLKIIENHHTVCDLTRPGTSQRPPTAAGAQKSRSHKGSIYKNDRFGTGGRNLIFQGSARLGQLGSRAAHKMSDLDNTLLASRDIGWRKPKEIAPSTPTNNRKGLTTVNGNGLIRRGCTQKVVEKKTKIAIIAERGASGCADSPVRVVREKPPIAIIAERCAHRCAD